MPVCSGHSPLIDVGENPRADEVAKACKELGLDCLVEVKSDTLS